MGTPGGNSRRLALTLVSAVLCCLTGVLCCEERPICGVSCCEVEPNCSTALHVTCQCPDLTLMSLREGDIPETVQTISVSGATKVVIHENAVHALTYLVTMELHRIDRLELRSGGLALQKTAKLFSLKIDNVRAVNISGLAFTGFWDRGTKITLQAIAELYIQRNGLGYRSAFAPSLSMDHVSLLEMASNGLAAPIRELRLAFVNMTSCNSESFSENITRIDLNHVNVTEMKKLCIRGSVNSTKLSVKSCSIGTIHSLGISGQFSDVSLSKTNITTVREHGFMLQAANVHVADSRIGELMSDGMSMSATNSINLNKIRVELLRKHGLMGLKSNCSTVGYLQPVRIHGLEVTQADEGSLAFARGINANFFRMNVSSPEPPVCPTEKWARWLVGKGEEDELSPVEHQILHQLHRRWLCGNDDKPAALGNRNGYSQEADSQEATKGEVPQAADESDVSQEEAETETGQGTDGSSTSHRVTQVDKASDASSADSSQGHAPTTSSVKTGDAESYDADPAATVTLMETENELGTSDRDRTGTPSPPDGASSGETEPAADGDGTGSTRRETSSTPVSTGSQSPSEELKPLKLQLLQLTRRLVEIERILEEIEAENGSRTLREVIVFTACAFYFVFKTYRWMDRRTDAEGRSRRYQMVTSQDRCTTAEY